LCWRDSDWTPARSAEPCDTSNKPIAAIEPAPAPIALAAATPMPAPAVEPAKPLPQKISFSGDALFAFDRSELKPEGKTMLDGLVHQLEGASFDKILVTGHTDRFGSNAYNQKLSERRAQTVKSYLVSKNLNSTRIDGEGKGETQPVTKDGDCLGAKSAKVIACLQPDRRVDVELVGAQAIAKQ
jgi:OOP family OmpA-OmpF porin